MCDEKKLKKARSVYNTLCEMLDDKKLTYKKHEEDLVITITMNGDDLPMPFVINIDASRELIRVVSSIPVTFGEDKRIEGALAACRLNYALADGSFDFDCKNGKVVYRMTSSYIDSLISKDLFEYMIGTACYTVDVYNDKFLMLSKGMITLEEFFKK